MDGPHKDEGPGDCGAEPFQQTNVQDRVASVDAGLGRDKQKETARAVYAQHGWCLYELADGSFLASAFAGWPPKPLPDLQAAMVFLRKLGGSA